MDGQKKNLCTSSYYVHSCCEWFVSNHFQHIRNMQSFAFSIHIQYFDKSHITFC